MTVATSPSMPSPGRRTDPFLTLVMVTLALPFRQRWKPTKRERPLPREQEEPPSPKARVRVLDRAPSTQPRREVSALSLSRAPALYIIFSDSSRSERVQTEPQTQEYPGRHAPGFSGQLIVRPRWGGSRGFCAFSRSGAPSRPRGPVVGEAPRQPSGGHTRSGSRRPFPPGRLRYQGRSSTTSTWGRRLGAPARTQHRLSIRFTTTEGYRTRASITLA